MATMDKAFWSRWEVITVTFIVIVVLVIAGGFASYNVISSIQDPAESGLTVKSGDAVSVNYIGMFEDGTVFDTSIQSVAQNDTMYPKSLSFNARTDYAPLNFTVGTGQMIKGFDKGVIGMSPNQTKVIYVSPEEGYGYSDESLIFKKSLTDSIPIYQWVGNTTEFADTYGVQPAVGITVKNDNYGWNATVSHIDDASGDVLIKNNPSLNEILQLSLGWSVRVMSIDSAANFGDGEIIVKHLLSDADIGTRMFSDNSGQQFTITQVDTVANTYTIDYNREVVGKTLIFKVTLVSVTPAAS